MSKRNQGLGAAFPSLGQPHSEGGDPSASTETSDLALAGKSDLASSSHNPFALKQTGRAALHAGETLGTLFLSSAIEGYVGRDKLKLGGIDGRAPVGLAMQGYGLYRIFAGQAGGEHLLAVANGVTGSWLSSEARELGEALKQRKASPTPSSPSAPQPSFRGEEQMVTVPTSGPDAASNLQSLLPQGYEMPQPDPGYFAGYPSPQDPWASNFAGAPQPPNHHPAAAWQGLPPGWQPPAGLLPPMPGYYDPRAASALHPQQAMSPANNPMPMHCAPLYWPQYSTQYSAQLPPQYVPQYSARPEPSQSVPQSAAPIASQFAPLSAQPSAEAAVEAPPQPQLAGPDRTVMLSQEDMTRGGSVPQHYPPLHLSPQPQETFEGRRRHGMALTPGQARRQDRRLERSSTPRPQPPLRQAPPRNPIPSPARGAGDLAAAAPSPVSAPPPPPPVADDSLEPLVEELTSGEETMDEFAGFEGAHLPNVFPSENDLYDEP